MKYLKKCLLAFPIILAITNVNAQIEYTEAKPGVNAQQFISATSGANSLHTGQISVNIPLFSLQGKGITIPISLSFSGIGITHESQANSIGLGWSLLAGGVLTRTIRGNDDELVGRFGREWQYQSGYLEMKRNEKQNNFNSAFELAMDEVNCDPEPDSWNYSFLGYSGDICFKYNTDGSSTGTFYPDLSFRIEKTTLGYKVTTNDGVEYYFETKEQKGSSTTSWFLSKIKTMQGGEESFEYSNVSYDDFSEPSSSGHYASITSKELTRINYDFGYITFAPNGKISNIELHDKNTSLIKGYHLNNNSYFVNECQDCNYYDARLKLDGIREYDHNGNYLPPYEFEYDYYFSFPLNASGYYNFPNQPKNTWAHNPTILASMDRSLNGDLCPWMSCNYVQGQCIPYPNGYNTTDDPIAPTTEDYLCLTKLKYPSGGYESYSYEDHDYHFLSNNIEFDQTDHYLYGKRLFRKVISDDNGNYQIVMYSYFLHDQDYKPVYGGTSYPPTYVSSGILWNPSIHTSTMYTPAYDRGIMRLAASPFYTERPQNSPGGSPVYYTEVEEDFITGSGESNGKNIYYFEKMHAEPAPNYVYLNYTSSDGRVFGWGNQLTNIPNTLFGKQRYPTDPNLTALSDQNFTYLAYPLGKFNFTRLNEGKLLKEVTLDANGKVVRKIENEYTAGDGICDILYGLVVKKFDDNNYSSNPYPQYSINRYLISQTKFPFGIKDLVKKTTTTYTQNESIVEDQSFVYNNLNLLKSSSTTVSNGGTLSMENVYPNEITFQTTSNLSDQASSINAMKSKNMIGLPVQTTVKKGNEFIKGTYSTFKQLSTGAIVVDSVFSLGVQPGASVSNPMINVNGKIERNPNFLSDVVYQSYNENGYPTTIVRKDGTTETLVWGYIGQYPVARLVNYTYDQVKNNSTLSNLLDQLSNYRTITDAERTNLVNCNKSIRNSLPQNVMITTYTYSPLVGVTSQTDPNGITTFYEYDSFGKIMNIRDNNYNILKHYDYHYKQ